MSNEEFIALRAQRRELRKQLQAAESAKDNKQTIDLLRRIRAISDALANVGL